MLLVSIPEVIKTNQFVSCCNNLKNIDFPLLCFHRPKKITLKSFKRGYFVFRDTTLTHYKSQEESHGLPLGRFNLNSKYTVYPNKLSHPRVYGELHFLLDSASDFQKILELSHLHIEANFTISLMEKRSFPIKMYTFPISSILPFPPPPFKNPNVGPYEFFNYLYVLFMYCTIFDDVWPLGETGKQCLHWALLPRQKKF